MDEAITKTYQNTTGRGQVNELALVLRMPKWKVSRRAIHLGLVKPAKKEPVWSEREIAFLAKWAHMVPEVIAKKLKSHGYHRTSTAIVLKRRRLRLLANLEGYNAVTLGDAFGVDPKTVTRWIEKGYLKATKRGTNRTEAQGGDMWWIEEKDIRSFIISHVQIIDFRKIEKHWIVDMLVNGDI
jgi:hypothetical protein